jgi:adenylate cyclase
LKRRLFAAYGRTHGRLITVAGFVVAGSGIWILDDHSGPFGSEIVTERKSIPKADVCPIPTAESTPRSGPNPDSTRCEAVGHASSTFSRVSANVSLIFTLRVRLSAEMPGLKISAAKLWEWSHVVLQDAEQPREERKLAAIMLTDLVGFTSMAQSNEALAMEILAEHRQMVRPILQRYAGREIKTMGDAFLVEFPNALDAIRCAVEIQKENRRVNSGRSPERSVMIRIGIHVGDVIHSEGDIFGDAVNISSRIEPVGEPGGVCISEQVYDQVWNKVDFRLVKMESQKFKNVSLPTDVYSVEMLPTEKAVEAVELDRLRLAVLPLNNMSPDPNDEYFAGGMTEELITTLSGISELSVIARTSVMPYKTAAKRVSEVGRELKAGTIIEGSVRKAANKVRISVQVIDARNEGHLWAQNYDKELNDIFAVQSEIAEKVAETLRVKLLESRKRRLETTGSGEAHTLHLRGKYYSNLGSKEAIEKATEYFKEAVEADPEFALGYAGLGECYGLLARNGQADPMTVYTKAVPYVTKALELDPNLAEAHADLAAFMFDYEHEPKKSESELRKAIELNPNYANAHQFLSHVLCSERRFDEAFAEIRRAVELNPLSPFINLSLGDALYQRPTSMHRLGTSKKHRSFSHRLKSDSAKSC